MSLNDFVIEIKKFILDCVGKRFRDHVRTGENSWKVRRGWLVPFFGVVWYDD